MPPFGLQFPVLCRGFASCGMCCFSAIVSAALLLLFYNVCAVQQLAMSYCTKRVPKKHTVPPTEEEEEEEEGNNNGNEQQQKTP